jgi:lysophospholipase L1-like esterase
MKKDHTPLSRRDLFRGAAHAGIASVLIPLSGVASEQPEESPISIPMRENVPTDLNAVALIYTPSVIYAAEGVETNIYFDNVIFSNLPNEFLSIDIICNKGRQYEKFWRLSPQPTDEGSTSFRIDVSFGGKLIASKTSELHISGKSAGSGKSLKVLCIGDSTTAGGNYISIINTDFQALNSPSMTFLGTRGIAPNKHEGRGGWKFVQYAGDGGPNTFQFNLNGVEEAPGNASVYTDGKAEFTISEINISGEKGYVAGRRTKGTDSPSANGKLTRVSGAGPDTLLYTNSAMTAANPFWNLKAQRLDFRKYLNDHGYTMSKDDLITVHLGINDVFLENSPAKLESIRSDFNKMVSEFRSVIPQINIGLCLTIPPSISQDAFAVSYASGQTLKGYMENYKQLVDFLLSNYDTPAMRASRIYCIGFNHAIDRTHNFYKTNMKANARNPQLIETWGNGVHPDNSGYFQMGDALYAFIKNLSR